MRRSDAGYVLLEVMLALVILMAGVLRVTESFRASIRVGQESEDGYRAALRIEARALEGENSGRWDTSEGADETLGPLTWQQADGALRMSWGPSKGQQTLELPVLSH